MAWFQHDKDDMQPVNTVKTLRAELIRTDNMLHGSGATWR